MSFNVNISLITVDENSSIKETMRVIDKNLIGIAFIVNKDHKLIGVVTDGDIRRALLEGVSLNEKISKIMNTKPITIKEGQDSFDENIRKNIPIGSSLKIPVLDEKGRIKNLMFLYDNSKTFSKSPSRKEHIKQVLVVGGAGYLGSVLIRKLMNEGYKVKVLDNLMYGDEGVKELHTSKNFTFVNGDMRNITNVVDAIKDVDAVVHLAALVGDPACNSNPRQAIEMNYLSTKLLADICKYNQINRFIFASTCSVYGASNGEELLDENSSLNPVSVYAEMKINSEKILLDMADENFSPTIMRMPTLFGKSPRMRFDLVVNLLTAKAVIDKKITVFGGQQWRPFLHLEDAADAYIKCLEAPIEDVAEKIFNVGSDANNYRIIQIAEMIKNLVPDAEIVIDNSNTDKRNYRISFKKFNSVFNLETRTSIEDGIKEIINLDESILKDYKSPRYANNRKL